MGKFVFLMSILFLLSCSQKESTYEEMKADELLSESFNDNELKNLAKIVDFFEREICVDKNLSKKECYKNFTKKSVDNYRDNDKRKFKVSNNNQFKLFKKLDSTFLKDKSIFKISYENQQKLFENLDSTFLKEVWVFYPEVIRIVGNHKFTNSGQYEINMSGKYFKFLKQFSNKDIIFKDFHRNFSASNDINFSSATTYLSNLNSEEYESITRRLFFTIYYLSINEDQQYQLKIEKI